MNLGFTRSRLAIAIAAAFGAAAMSTSPETANADTGRGNDRGTYAAGDFHNHTTCSDGSISMQKLVKKSTDKIDTPWGLDWFVQAGHGGNGNRNCTLVEDPTLGTPAYPFVTGQGPNTTWAASIGSANIKGDPNPPLSPTNPDPVNNPNRNMWRWQSIQEFQYPVLEYLSALKDLPLFIGIESVVAGHEHTSATVLTGQMPAGFDDVRLPNTPPFVPLGNATALAQWEYCFDRADADTSRGNTTPTSGVGNNWECSVPGSANSTDPAIGFNTTAQKIIPVAPTGTNGHLKTVEAVKWMATFHPKGAYY